MSRRIAAPVALFFCMVLAGCGFQLQGSETLPFKTIYIGVHDTSPVAVSLKRSLRGANATEVVSDPKAADVRFELLGESVHVEILTINSLGLAAEYNLYYTMRFRVTDNAGHTYIPATDLMLKRLVIANANAQLAENFEIQQLQADMQGDAAHQILRRMAALKPGHFVTDATVNPNGAPAPVVPINSGNLSLPVTTPSTAQ